MKKTLQKLGKFVLIASVLSVAVTGSMNAQKSTNDVNTGLVAHKVISDSPTVIGNNLPTTFSFPNAIVDKQADMTTGIISTENTLEGVYGADFFELTSDVDLGELRFYGFSTSSNLFHVTTAFNVIIYSNNAGFPNGNPSVAGGEVLELRNISNNDYEYVGGVFTLNVAQVNGSPVTLPAGEYWISAFTTTSEGDVFAGRWNWYGSTTTSTHEAALIDPTDGTNWGYVSSLIGEAFPSFAWVMTEEGDNLPPEDCVYDIISDIEPITNVTFAGINNSSSSSSTDAFEDFTSIEGNVEQGGSYTIELEGYTGGNFTNYFTVWIDWDQSGTYDPSLSSNEVYQIGSITNSTGTDGIKATSTIDVPLDAVLGATTMIIIKEYGEYPLDPCMLYYYGQAEEYTINVTTASNCDAVTNVTVTDIDETTATVDWTASATATGGYTVEVYEAGADITTATPVFTVTVAAGIVTADVSGLTEGTDYDVYVISDCETEGEATSSVVTFTTESVPVLCDAVTNVTVTDIDETTATVDWTASATATGGYTVEVYEAGADITTATPVFTVTVAAGIVTADVSGLTEGTDYDVYVISDCETEGEATSSVVTFTTESDDVGINKLDMTNVAVYPNPTTSSLNIVAPATLENVELFTVLGNRVVNLLPKTSNVTMDISTLPAGVYILKVYTEDAMGTIRIVKK